MSFDLSPFSYNWFDPKKIISEFTIVDMAMAVGVFYLPAGVTGR